MSLPQKLDRNAVLMLLAGLCVLYGPLLFQWAQGAWLEDRHEALIFCVSAWLLYRQRVALAELSATRSTVATILLILGLLLFLFGTVIDVQGGLVLSLIFVLAACIGQFCGRAGLRLAWFPIAFLFFAYPLPHEVVLGVTGPLKEAVSAAATQILSALGFPAGNSGVVITIGQYQLLIVEACAGLQTMFTLEAMGLLYASLMNHSAVLRNVLLACFVVPISFVANVVRVVVLALVTYYWGDAAGQGFLHGFAGIVLFMVALMLIVLVDGLLGRLLAKKAVAS